MPLGIIPTSSPRTRQNHYKLRCLLVQLNRNGDHSSERGRTHIVSQRIKHNLSRRIARLRYRGAFVGVEIVTPYPAESLPSP